MTPGSTSEGSSAPALSPDAVHAPIVVKLAYNAKEACQALSISSTTLWRLEKRGLVRAVPGLRHKLYSVDVLRRFANGMAGEQQ